MTYNRFFNLASTVPKFFFLILVFSFLGCATGQSEESKAVDGPEDGVEIQLSVLNGSGTPVGQKIPVSYQIDNHHAISFEVTTNGSGTGSSSSIWAKNIRVGEKVTLTAILPSDFVSGGGDPQSNGIRVATSTRLIPPPYPEVDWESHDSQISTVTGATITAVYPKLAKTNETISILPQD